MKTAAYRVLTVLIVCISIAIMPYDSFARGGRQGVPVVVKNFPDSIAVSNIPESIAVNNFPATVSVDNFPTSVTVENMPEVIEVPVGSAPVKTPFQYSSSDYWENEHGDTVLGIGEHTEEVPEGKRLVVEHLSYSISSDGFLGDPICEARVKNGALDVVAHPLVTTMSVYRESTLYRVSIPITLYADAGTEVGVSCWVLVSEDVREKLGVTGYLVDVE